MDIPEDAFEDLENLNMSDNRLTAFPNGICRCLRLQRFYANFNEIVFEGRHNFDNYFKVNIFRNACKYREVDATPSSLPVAQQVEAHTRRGHALCKAATSQARQQRVGAHTRRALSLARSERARLDW